MRPTLAVVDLDAISHNVSTLAAHAGEAVLCAVVKADGYTHGAVPVARAALRAGATWLAVALVDEGIELRDAGITSPILLLSEPRPHEMAQVAAFDLRATVYTGEGLAAAAAAAKSSKSTITVHVKVDTGMHRVGCAPDEVVAFAVALADKPGLEFEGVWSHCAVADEPDNPFTDKQIAVFDRVLADLEAQGLRPAMQHLANSALTLARPDQHRDLVRCGIEVYGVPPSDVMEVPLDLRPAITLRSEVSFLKTVAAGESLSYGLRWTAPEDRRIATIPIGYADGVRRSLHEHGGEVLIRGVRRPIVGVITMDQLMVDCGSDETVLVGDEVILIGSQGDDEITVNEVAAKLDTIGYEVVCDIGPRVRRQYR